MSYTIKIWKNDDVVKGSWLIQIPKKGKEHFEEEILPRLQYIGRGDHYVKWLKEGYGGYYINSPVDQKTIKDGALMLGYKLWIVKKKHHKVLRS